MQNRFLSSLLPRTVRRLPLAGILLLTGCVTPSESSQAMAERYAQQERRSIDRQSFQQARERSHMQRGTRGETGRLESAPPLPVDATVIDRWQFGTFAHPRSGEPVCAALSGRGEPAPVPGEPVPRLLVLADGAWVISDVPLAAGEVESTFRIDAELPIPIEVSATGRLTARAMTWQGMHARLRAGAVVTLRVTASSSLRPDISASMGGTEEVGSGIDTPFHRASDAIERVFDLDRFPVIFDELERCAEESIPAREDDP